MLREKVCNEVWKTTWGATVGNRVKLISTVHILEIFQSTGILVHLIFTNLEEKREGWGFSLKIKTEIGHMGKSVSISRVQMVAEVKVEFRKFNYVR